MNSNYTSLSEFFHLVSVSSSGYLSTTFMISRHTNPMLSIFLSSIFSLKKETLNYGLQTKGHYDTVPHRSRRVFIFQRMGERKHGHEVWRLLPSVNESVSTTIPDFYRVQPRLCFRYAFVVSSQMHFLLTIIPKYFNVHTIWYAFSWPTAMFFNVIY